MARREGRGIRGAHQPDGNLWAATAREQVAALELHGEATADLVIIGGGYTGCSAALHAAEAGLSVRLLEAETIGHGGSGRNVGLVNAGLWTPPEEIAATIGPEAGARLSTILAAAPDQVFGLIERHRIACEPVRNGTLHCAHSQGGLKDLQGRLRQLEAQGAPVTLLSPEETAERTGSPQFHGALHDARAGTIQPLAYCLGLARAAQGAGAALHERTPATKIAQDGDGWRVATPSGAVRAGALLLATNAYHQALEGLQAPRSIPVCYFQLATRPLGHNLRRSLLPGGEGAWDTALVMSSFRKDQAGRLVIGAIGSLNDFGRGAHRAWASRKMATLYPELKDEPFEYGWFGRIAMTSDHLPKILRLGPNAYAAFGYSGRGIGPGTVFGKAMAEMVGGGGEAALPVTPVDDHRERLVGLKRRYYEFGATATHLCQR